MVKRNNIKYLVILSCFVHFLMLLSVTQAQANEWKLSKDEEGIQVFLRDTPNSALKSFMGKTTVNTDIASLVSQIEDTSSYPKWLHNCKSAKTVKKLSNNQNINYIVTDMPWPVVDRDAVLMATKTVNQTSKAVQITLHSNSDAVPLVEGKVRIKKIQGRWVLTPVDENKVNIVYEMSIDPGGGIPKWVVNSMTVDLPFHTLNKLRNLVEK